MDQELSKVSIILPTYNGSRYIKQSIDSCLSQTYRNIELIIVDDCSTDNTPDIIRTYDDSRIKYIRHDKNKNLPNALNTGFKNATGDYLTWTSDDNYYSVDAIEKMVKFLQDNKCDFVYSDYYRFNDNSPSILEVFKNGEVTELYDYNIIGACFLYTRGVREIIGDYDPDTVLAEDYDYWIRISKRFIIKHLAQPLYYYRIHPNSLSAKFSKELDIVVTDHLVKVKNGIWDIDKATMMLTNAIIYNLTSSNRYLLNNEIISWISNFVKKITFGKLDIYWCYRSLVADIYSRRIYNVLRDFDAKKISLNTAKSSLKHAIPLI